MAMPAAANGEEEELNSKALLLLGLELFENENKVGTWEIVLWLWNQQVAIS